MFFIGNGIFYPRYGAGIILNIEEKEIYGITKKYYIIRLISNNMLTMIPVDFEESRKLRKIIDKNDCLKVLEILREESNSLPLKWGDRYRLYNNSINNGDIFKLGQLLRDIYNMKSVKEVSKSDIRIYEEILDMVAGELSISLEMDVDSVKKLLEDSLNGL